jgi:hypothetical protein
MSSRDDRLAENQRTFRTANERLIDLAQPRDGQRVPFLCECADIECLGRVEASLGEFEVIHEDPGRYFIVPGHALVQGEGVLSSNDRYQVVRKA